jgi:hypothetical protein
VFNKIKEYNKKISFIIMIFSLLFKLNGQTYIGADPFYLLQTEKLQFEDKIPINSNIFRPIYFNTDTSSLTLFFKNENYFNSNAPNQENMDVRYFSKGYGNFQSFLFAFNSKYLSLMFEPYILNNKIYPVKNIKRDDIFSVLNDRELPKNVNSSGLRNLLAVLHYKGFGFGLHKGNKWWGPGIHSSFQMTTNTKPFLSQYIGTIQEIRIGKFGLYVVHTFSKLKESNIGDLNTYHTSLNGKLTWYGPAVISAGFSRNYLTGGRKLLSGYTWSEKDAKKIVFEGLFTSNLLENEYTVGGHDEWDETLSGYFNISLPNKGIKLYAEVGFNDNRMYFADFLSQPDHSMATIFGVRDYGIGKFKNMVWGFEWLNMMITYTSRFRVGGPGTWYQRNTYQFSSYKGRRWGAHSGADSDDWYLYLGYLSDKLVIIPALNYERHGIVTHRPAEVKMEFRLDTRYKYRNIWFGLYYENQFEAFLGFPDYFYIDDKGTSIDSAEGRLANTRKTNTFILSISKQINY